MDSKALQITSLSIYVLFKLFEFIPFLFLGYIRGRSSVETPKRLPRVPTDLIRSTGPPHCLGMVRC